MNPRIKIFELVAIILFCLGKASPSIAAVLYVDHSATGANDGSSWNNAYNHLQDALAAAQLGDEIWVAKGIYKPDQGTAVTSGDRGATFQLKNGVALYGGFVGDEMSLDERHWQNNETILSGDLGGNDVVVMDTLDLLTEPTRNENSFHVVTGSFTDATAVIDGLVITAGRAAEVWPESGGGMLNYPGSPTVSNCTFVGNSGDHGGAMYNREGSCPVLTNCEFVRNAAGHGGGMNNSHSSSASLTDCAFVRNSAKYHGGGIYNQHRCNLTVVRCTFSQNSGGNSGGAIDIWKCYNATITMTECSFTSNIAFRGGGINQKASCSTLTACTFEGNSATGAGGGVHNYSNSDMALTKCRFNQNSAVESGGGIANQASPTLADCTFTANTGGEGGGMYNSPGARPKLERCTFAENVAMRGGGFSIVKGTGTLTSCVFEHNTASESGAGVHNGRYSYTALTDCTFSNNSGDIGAGLYNGYKSEALLKKCSFSENSAGREGGGVHNTVSSDLTAVYCSFEENSASYGAGIWGSRYSADLVDCIFRNNLARLHGGGMYNTWGTPILRNCTFRNNSATNEGGAICNWRASNSILSGCTFEANTADLGGALYNRKDSCPVAVNCIFAANSAHQTGGATHNGDKTISEFINCLFIANSANEGGGVWNDRLAHPVLTNCTLAENSAQNYGGGMYNVTHHRGSSQPQVTNCILWGNCDTAGGDESAQTYGGEPIINFCCMQGWTGNLGGVQNTGADPLFVEPGSDYHLLSNSSCIDTGDNGALPADIADLDDDDDTEEPIPFDLDGNPRVIGDIVDIGAYELSVIEVPVDIKPGSCPNPLNVTSKGAIPAAIVGTAEFDVTTVDPASVTLVGVSPVRCNYEDVCAAYHPFVGKDSELDCTQDGPDGILDMTVKFETQEVISAIEAVVGQVTDGDVVVVPVTGNLLPAHGGIAIEGEDVVLILKKGKK